MHRSVSLIFLISMGLSSYHTLEAQPSQDSSFIQRKNAISMSPVFLAVGTINISYERALSKKTGLNFIADYQFRTQIPTFYSQSRLFFAQLQSRFYPFGKAPKGFSVGGYLFYGTSSFLTNSFTFFDDNGIGGGATTAPAQAGSLSSISWGVMVAYKFLIMKRIALDISMGCGPNYHWGDSHGFPIYPLSDEFLAVPGISLGYTFR